MGACFFFFSLDKCKYINLGWDGTKIADGTVGLDALQTNKKQNSGRKNEGLSFRSKQNDCRLLGSIFLACRALPFKRGARLGRGISHSFAIEATFNHRGGNECCFLLCTVFDSF